MESELCMWVVMGKGRGEIGGRGEGHTASIGLGDLSGVCASLLTAHEATQTPPEGADATLQYEQPRSPLAPASISPLHKVTTHATSPEAARPLPTASVIVVHITLVSTKHSICSSWVRWYILQWHAYFLTSSGMSSVILFKTIDIASNLAALSTCTHAAAILITTSQTTLPNTPEALTNTSASPVQLPTCQEPDSPYLPNIYSTTRLLPLPMTQPDPQAPPPFKHQPTPTATTITHLPAT